MEKLSPKPFQVPIVGKICASLEETGRALIVMATGTGKTLTAAFAIKRRIRRPSKTKRMLVLAHINAILVHLEKEFTKLFPKSSVNRLYDGGSIDHGADIVYANFGTIRNRIADGVFDPDDFEVVVVDEGHHAQADGFRDVITFFKPKDLIGMTATPDRMDGKDIRELFGEPVVTVTLAQAMAKGYVTKVRYKLMSAEGLAEEVEAIRKEIAAGTRLTKKQIERRLFQKANDHGFLELMEELDPKAKVIAFVDSIDRAKDLAGKVRGARAYHSELEDDERTALLEDFRAGTVRRLTSVDALNEGVDVPDTDVVVFLRSTESLTIFLQQLGRGLRLAPGKEWVTVYDFVGTVQRLKMLHDFLQEVKRNALEEVEAGGEEPAMDGAICDGSAQTKEEESSPFDLGDIESVKVDFTQELVDIFDILSSLEKNYYPTLAEASAAASKLGIKTSSEYMGKDGFDAAYKKDQKLPSDPGIFYRSEWVSWPDFLGTSPYPTLAEASAAASKLGIKTSSEYMGKKGFKAACEKDPRLHRTPHTFYHDWVSWPDFLGTSPYPTLAEASAAARKLGIKTSSEYMGKKGFDAAYKKDPRLHSNPDTFYRSEWVSWPDFLGTSPYPTLAEASAAARKLGIKTAGEYKGGKGIEAAYKKDPRLPSDPGDFYPSEWVSWPEFLGNKAR